MKQVIMQSCGKAETVEEFYDWKAGQNAISDMTGFEYATYDTKTGKIVGYYNINHDPKTLNRGQKSVFI